MRSHLRALVALLVAVTLSLMFVVSCGDDEDEPTAAGAPSERAFEVAEQWGKAWESGDNDAVVALYTSDTDERYIVDQTYGGVWRDVEAAIDQINSANDFDRFELVRFEDFGIAAAAEYEVQWAPEGDSPADREDIVVVFVGLDNPDGLIVGSDIYVPAWVNLFEVDYGPFGESMPPMPMSMPPASGVEDGQTVAVTVRGVSGHDGHELAGVLYAGGDLVDLDREALGGFWSVISDDDYTTTEVVREPANDRSGRFPYVSEQALLVEPGTYTLVVWVDVGLGPATRWVPINTDGQGLFGCQYLFEVAEEAQTDIVVPANLHPDGWNTNCVDP